jgi:hypothetical protein
LILEGLKVMLSTPKGLWLIIIFLLTVSLTEWASLFVEPEGFQLDDLIHLCFYPLIALGIYRKSYVAKWILIVWSFIAIAFSVHSIVSIISRFDRYTLTVNEKIYYLTVMFAYVAIYLLIIKYLKSKHINEHFLRVI